jgi:hypothetical protein
MLVPSACQTAQHYVTEDCDHSIYCVENVRSHVLFLLNWLDIDVCFDYTLNFIYTFNMIKYY